VRTGRAVNRIASSRTSASVSRDAVGVPIMLATRRVRRLHRLLGAVVGVQVLLWCASGIYFSWTDIDQIRGDHLRTRSASTVLDSDWVSPAEIDFSSASVARPRILTGLDVVEINGVTHYRLRVDRGEDQSPAVILAGTTDGIIRGPLNREEAVATARASFAPNAEVLDVELLVEGDVGLHHEYRGRPLPAWRVRFVHDSRTHIYVSANEAEVVTHRNRGWRIFDALWMLHTMDFSGRDDFNNPLLRGASVLALVLTLSGYLMWFRTRPRRRTT